MRLRSTQSSDIPRQEGPRLGRRPIGEVLDLGQQTADEVVQRQRETGRLFGETAVELGLTSSDEVRRAIEAQQGFHVLDRGDERIDPIVIAAFDPDDVLARAARDLRARITAAVRKDGRPVRSVALIGVGATRETTLLASNLGVACAQAGHSTLLLDANLEDPQQHILFRQPNRVGLSTLLSDATDAASMSQPTAIPSLSVMTAGPAVPNAFELLDRQRLSRNLRTLEDRFGLILIDGARALDHALAACDGVDAVILVVRRDVSRSDDVQNVATHVREQGALILGSVMSS